tara:strand:+ start:317 stop:847 length:531 start_codon:yes stop_codon:yes gene_type:complete
MPKKNEDAPANATGAAVAGTGDDAQAWKKKKKKKKKDMYDGKTMDQLHDLIKQGKSADEIAKLMKLDKNTIQALMEEDVVATAPIQPDSTFASMPVFKVNNADFSKCKFGKSKFARWAKHIDVNSESGRRIYAYAKKNPNKSIIVQHEKSGHMLYLRKYSKTDGGKSGIMVKRGKK